MLRFCFAMFLLVDLRFPVSAIDPFMSENENANGFSEVFVRSGVTTDDEESFGSGNDTVDFIDSRSFYKVDIMNQALQPGDCITRQKQLDMVFVLDTTLESTLSHMKEFVMDTLKIFELGQDKIRVAVTAAQGNAIVTLNQGIGHRQVQSLLGNLGTSATFNVVSALDAGRRITTDGSREVRKVIVIVTCAEEVVNPRLAPLVSSLTSTGHHLLVVAIGPLNPTTIQILGSVVRPGSNDLVRVDQIWSLANSKALNRVLTEAYGCDPCIPNPCRHGSTCTPLLNKKYSCRCPSGYVGGVCNGNVPCGSSVCTANELCVKLGSSLRCTNPCSPNPCQHGGTCRASLSGSTGISINCQCPSGFSGSRCSISNRVSVCENVACLNRGRCVVNTAGQAVCECYEVYIGSRCEFTPCHNYLCENGGTCLISSTYQPECICALGYTGTHCTQGNSPCDNHQCLNGGTCINGLKGAVCYCPRDYIGNNCQRPLPSPCKRLNCKNKGICKVKSDGNPVCVCDHFYIGPTCEETPCDNYYCSNGGTCVIGSRPNYSAFCVCLAGYSGMKCEVETTDPCSQFPCLNGGSCGVIALGSAVCTCTALYDGSHCEYSKCRSHYSCKNGGSCGLTNGHLPLTCNCPFPYTGADCSMTLCQKFGNCLNGATCQYRGQQPYCNCLTPYTGTFCENRPVLVDPCSPNPCRNSGNCINTGTSYRCDCRFPYTTSDCSRTLCQQFGNCLNGGTCQYRGQQPYCNCLTPYTGTFCENRPVLVDPCSPNPCRNSGNCINTGTSYRCDCRFPYTTSDCSRTLCQLFGNCLNGGTCQYLDQQAYCNCVEPYYGSNCANRRVVNNPCSPNPCMNSGTCTRSGTSSSAYTCACPFPLTGANCGVTLCQMRSKECSNGGTCDYNSSQQPYCRCRQPYDGEFCEQIVQNACFPNPCQHGGTCITQPGTNQWVCRCPRVYIGRTCSQSACSCHHGGTCTDTPSGPRCFCPSGFEGAICEIPVQQSNPCMTNPCKSGEICLPNSSGYTCSAAGNTVCSSNPCSSPCVCRPSSKHTNGFVCQSTQGYLGKTCSIPPPDLKCSTDEITVSVDRRLFTELLGNFFGEAYFFMGQDYNGTPVPSCKGIVSGSKYNFRLASQFSACGTRTGRDTNGDITVSNRIWFNIGGNALFDMPVPVFTFQCTFQENYNVVASLETMVDDNNKIVQGSHEKTFTGSFQMCKMLSQCPVICPAQFVVQPNGVYTVGEDLNLVIHHTPNIVPSGSTLSVHTLYISCSPDPTSAAVISVISNGCPTNIIPSAVFTSASSTCVTFQVQRLLACNKVYIHASMDVCVSNILQTCTSPSSVRKCPASTRGRRSEDGEEVFGPIYILPHKNKSNKSNGSKDEEISDSKNNFALIPLLGVLVAFVLIASVILIISLFRSYRKDEYTVSSRPTVVGT